MSVSPRIKLASSDLEVSRFILGAWRFQEAGFTPKSLVDFLHACLEQGISTIDHADIYGDYGCEALFGQALALDPSLKGQFEIISKCGIVLPSSKRPENSFHIYDTSKAHIITSVETSLRLLGVEALDVLLIHRPDPLMDALKIAEAFGELKTSGLVKHFGVSNFLPWQFDLIQAALDDPLVCNQIEVSLLNMDALHNGSLDQAQRLGINPLAWSPTGGGHLFTSDDPKTQRIRNELSTIARELETSIESIVYAWLLKHPSKILPIVGSSKIERIQSAHQALNIELSREHWFRLWTASQGHEIP